MPLKTLALGAAALLCAFLSLSSSARATDDPNETCPVCARVKGLMLDLGQEVSAAQGIPRRVYDLRGGKARMSSYSGLIRTLAAQDAVFVGEYHDDPATHKLELDLLAQLNEAHPGGLSVGMEMFERDVQPALDSYISGASKEEDFMWAARPWDNYPADYRPIIEFCRAKGIHVTASNTPTELVRRISRTGFETAMQSYTADERGFLAAETTSPHDQYWDNFKNVMGLGQGHGEGEMTEEQVYGFYQAQCMKDDTMAEGMARWRESHPGQMLLHYSGSFHVDYRLGTAARYMARRPEDKTLVVVLRPVESWSEFDPNAEPAVADFVIFVPGPKWGKPHEMVQDETEAAEAQLAPAS